MAMYHSAELAFLSAVYGNLLNNDEPMDLFFRPDPGAFGGLLRIAPDLLPPKSVKLMQVWVNGHEHANFDATALTVTLPRSTSPQVVRVRVAPAAVEFSADLIDASDGNAQLSLAGTLGAVDLPALKEQVEAALTAGARTLSLDVSDLIYLDPDAVRYLALTRQHRDITLTVAGAKGQVAEELRDSELNEELATAGTAS
jgi:anti-anti-sigma regulatory factor